MNPTAWNRFATAAPGALLPPLQLTITLTMLVMYAGATWDFHRLHYDAAFARAVGMPAPVMDGQMVGALLARQLMGWGGPDAFVRRLRYRQTGIVAVGDRIVVAGIVAARRLAGGRPLVLCRQSVTRADGVAVVRGATAILELGSPTEPSSAMSD